MRLPLQQSQTRPIELARSQESPQYIAFRPQGGGVKYYLAEIHSIDRFHITLVLVQSLHCRLVGFREANSSHTSLMLQSRQAYLKTGSGYGKFLKLVHFFSQLVKGNPANWRRR